MFEEIKMCIERPVSTIELQVVIYLDIEQRKHRVSV